jgi:selenide,water dikinase
MIGHPRYPLIFDPKTAGGLLASVPTEKANKCIVALRGMRYMQASVIGKKLPQGDSLAAVTQFE